MLSREILEAQQRLWALAVSLEVDELRQRERRVARRLDPVGINPAHWPLAGEQYGWVALPSQAGLYGYGVWT